MISRSLLSCVMLFVVVAAGCGAEAPQRKTKFPVYPVEGTINLNGAPLADATITFYNEKTKQTAFAQSGPSGEFKVTTFNINDGLVEGSHVVTVTKTLVEDTGPAADVESDEYVPPAFAPKAKSDPESVNAIPAKYTKRESTDLQVSISAQDANEITLDLSSK